MSLTGKTKASTYKDLLQMNNSNNGVDGTLRNIVDGEGTVSSIYVSDDEFKVHPVTNGTNTFSVESGSSEDLLLVDTTNKVVKTGLGQQYANTGYLEYGCDPAFSSGFTAGTHFAIPANGSHGYAQSATIPNFGSGSDPDLTQTYATAGAHIPKLWHFLPDAIIIDQVYIWIGNEDSGSDVVRFHLMSYAIETSAGATCGDLTDGAIIASGSDITTTDNGRLHYQTLSASPSEVSANRVLVLTLEQDTINSDVGVDCKIKYHLK
tara:strand:+ start:1071 stop:1862 length:792 start_codon:yes stop_codon:yes gene_type:complete